MTELGIGKLAELTGLKVATIRFYEQNGLVPSPSRSAGGQRRYDGNAVHRLKFIRHARDLGFAVDDIRHFLTLAKRPTLSCEAVEEIARHHLRQVEKKMALLQRIRSELKRMIAACGGGFTADCRILEALAQDAMKKQEVFKGTD